MGVVAAQLAGVTKKIRISMLKRDKDEILKPRYYVALTGGIAAQRKIAYICSLYMCGYSDTCDYICNYTGGSLVRLESYVKSFPSVSVTRKLLESCSTSIVQTHADCASQKHV